MKKIFCARGNKFSDIVIPPLLLQGMARVYWCSQAASSMSGRSWPASNSGKSSSLSPEMTALSRMWEDGTGSRLREALCPLTAREEWQITSEFDSLEYRLHFMTTEFIRGKLIASYRKKLLSLYATAYITIETNGESIMGFTFASGRFTYNTQSPPPIIKFIHSFHNKTPTLINHWHYLNHGQAQAALLTLLLRHFSFYKSTFQYSWSNI